MSAYPNKKNETKYLNFELVCISQHSYKITQILGPLTAFFCVDNRLIAKSSFFCFVLCKGVIALKPLGERLESD